MRDATDPQDEPCVRAHAGKVLRDDPAEAREHCEQLLGVLIPDAR